MRLRGAAALNEARRLAALLAPNDVLVSGIQVGYWVDEHRSNHPEKAAALLVPLNDVAGGSRKQLTPAAETFKRSVGESILLKDMVVEFSPWGDVPSAYATDLDSSQSIPDAWSQSPTAAVVRSALRNGAANAVLSGHSNVLAVFAGPQHRGDRFTGDAAIVVVVATKGFVPLGEDCLPSEMLGALVDVVAGALTHSVSNKVFPKTASDVKGGISIGVKKPNGGAGTLGILVRKAEENSTVATHALTCAHVVEGLAKEIIAPAMRDRDRGRDPVLIGRVTAWSYGETADYKPLPCTLDAALIKLEEDFTGAVHEQFELSPDEESRLPTVKVSRVLNVHDVVDDATPNRFVVKVGRTSGALGGILFDGECEGNAFRVTRKENLPPSLHAKDAVFVSQYLVRPLAKGDANFDPESDYTGVFALQGDSGSVVTLNDGRLLGLYHARLTVDYKDSISFGVVTPADAVFAHFGIELVSVT